jgi:hypothetical protein
MSCPSNTSLSQLVNDLTVRHTTGTGDVLPPPRCAAQDPLQEILLRERLARLPAQVAERMLASQTPAQVDGWLAAGAVYELVAENHVLASQYLDQLSRGNPNRAALALAQAYADQVLIPHRSSPWYRADALGIGLQVLAAIFLLFLRTIAWIATAYFCAAPSNANDPAPWSLLGEICGGPVFTTPLKAGLLTDVLLATMVVWLCAEAVLGPRLMEAARRWPFRWTRQTLPDASRLEPLYVVWYMQSACLSLMMVVRFGTHEFANFSDVTVATISWLVFLSLCLTTALSGCASMIQKTVFLGTREVR